MYLICVERGASALAILLTLSFPSPAASRLAWSLHRWAALLTQLAQPLEC
jgi:hypothetical protein